MMILQKISFNYSFYYFFFYFSLASLFQEYQQRIQWQHGKSSILSSASLIRAPSIFRSDEDKLHKYSAILAATEPFRLQCQEQLLKEMKPLEAWKNKFLNNFTTDPQKRRKTIFEQGNELRKENSIIENTMSGFESKLQHLLQ